MVRLLLLVTLMTAGLALSAAAAADETAPDPAPNRAAGARQGLQDALQKATQAVEEAIQEAIPALRKPRATSPPRSGDEALSVKDILQQIDETDSELVRLGLKQKQAPAAQRPTVHVLLDPLYLGFVYERHPQGQRFLAAQLHIANLTDKKVTLRRGDIELIADGTSQKIDTLPDRVRQQSFVLRNRHYQIANLKTPEQVTIAPGEAATAWVTFAGIDDGAETPQLALRLKFGADAAEVNLNHLALAGLRLEVERIGPRKCLALLTIGGELTTANVGELVGVLDRLAAQQVVRAVLRWKKDAAPVDHQIWHWMQQASMRAGQSGEIHNSYPHLPTFPVSIREFHLVQPPGNSGQSVHTHYHNGVPLRAQVHKTDAQAVEAALETVYEGLPPDEILDEIERGHPLTRPAALARGGGRLPVEYLPKVLAYTEHQDEILQKAALIALAEYGDSRAIEKLVEVARRNEDPVSTTAIESLAASRFAAAHRALLELLRSEDEQTRIAVVKVLAHYPRPIWSDVLYEFAQQRDSTLSVDALRALMGIGHPRLNDLLKQTLQQGNESVKSEVFNLLASREDSESEELALQYMLEYLETREPTSQMYQLLQRTKDQRAVPLLLKRLESENNRSMLVNVLAQIGDQRVADALVEVYPKLRSHEQANVLNALQQLQSPKFRELAGKALKTNESALINTACQGLITDGSRESVDMIIQAFDRSDNQRAWNYLANALGTIGTPAARAALLRARDSSNANKRSLAVNALQNLRQRSPGYQYVYRGQQAAREGNWKEAAKQYGLAIRMDSSLSDAYSGRGSALLNLDKLDDARKDFAKAVELDPYNSQAITGVAIVQILGGQTEKGVQSLEESRDKFKNFDQMVFAYNAACVYSRAFAQAQEDEDDAAQRYRQKALEELKRSIDAGYRDFDLIRNDPDMVPLQNLPEFKKLVPQSEQDNAGAAGRAQRGRAVIIR